MKRITRQNSWTILFLEPKVNYSYFYNQSLASYLDKGFWRETKITSSEGRTKPCLTGSALSLPWKKSLWGSTCLSTKGCHAPPTTASPPLPPGSLCVQSASSSNSNRSVGTERLFCVYTCTLLLFIKMDLNHDASRREDELGVFTTESKNAVWGKMQ